MNPTSREVRHLKFGRFGRRTVEHDDQRAQRRGRWTGYQPLHDAVTQARLAALTQNSAKSAEDE
jgi:hypothetical protein